MRKFSSRAILKRYGSPPFSLYDFDVKYMDKLKARNPSYRVEAEVADSTRDAVMRLAKADRAQYDKTKKLERRAAQISKMVGMKH